MIKLVASDLDGTIIDSNNNIYQNNFDAIKSMKDKNIEFVICTGKTYSIIKDTCSKINAHYGIFGNGNQIINLKTGEEIYKNLLTPDEIDKCFSIAQKNGLHIHLYTNAHIVTENLLYMDLRNFKLNNSNLDIKIVKSIKDYLKETHSDVYKLVISSTDSLSNIQKEIINITGLSVVSISKRGKYKDTVIDKEYEYLDITSKGINKSHALEVLGNYINVTKSEMLAIGDNLNDLDMIKDSGIGVAVANAYDELKQVAKYTTVNPVEKGGFAEAVYKYIKF